MVDYVSTPPDGFRVAGSDERHAKNMRYTESRMRIGELLVEQGAITEDQLSEALAVQARRGGKLADVLLKLEYLDKDALQRVVSTQPGVASVDLTRYRLSSDLCHLIPEDFALKHMVFPIDTMGHTLTVGMAVPLDTATIDEIRGMTGMTVKAFYCKPDAIRAAIKQYYRPFGEIDWSELLKAPPPKKRKREESDAESEAE